MPHTQRVCVCVCVIEPFESKLQESWCYTLKYLLLFVLKKKDTFLHSYNIIVIPKKLSFDSITLSNIQSIITFPQLFYNVFYSWVFLGECLSVFIQDSCIAFSYHVHLVSFNLILPTSSPAFLVLLCLPSFLKSLGQLSGRMCPNLVLCDCFLVIQFCLSNFGKNDTMRCCSHELWINSRTRILPSLSDQIQRGLKKKRHFWRWEFSKYMAFHSRVRCPKQNEKMELLRLVSRIIHDLKEALVMSNLATFVESSGLRFGQGQPLLL